MSCSLWQTLHNDVASEGSLSTPLCRFSLSSAARSMPHGGQNATVSPRMGSLGYLIIG